MQPPCWRREVFGLDCLIKSRQLKTQPSRVRSLNACFTASLEKAPQALVTKCLDHLWRIVVCSAVRYNMINKLHPSRHHVLMYSLRGLTAQTCQIGAIV